ncbi:baseplate J/gp47 family protein [Paraneptunicella aestuarii]|uniref:baseplate assembly protein n=1 Tax=Paraneptunicella aestuarii TaxID=2831148 RepID=UPI001E64F1E9|nr:baseplate J/gp47 family protein [Paraneptunicella aestuarii]UAA38215.1 baseplate J/gp47 family protein [Paraneptunicella aestuarii]
MNNAINLSQLPSPDVIESLDYEAILEGMLADLRSRAPEFTATVESDPAYKILEVAAYRELLLRQRINDAARSVMLAYAKGSDLDNLAALFGVTRQITQAGDPNASPPVPDTYEDDERLRKRLPLSLEGFSTAGPSGAYRFHALNSSGEVKDVSIISPTASQVTVTVLANTGDGTPSAELLTTVDEHLNSDDIRPLTDQVTVQSATIVPYQVDATLTFYSGPDRGVTMATALKKVEEYVSNQHRLGYDINLSGLYAALHQPGVHKVTLTSPVSDIVITPEQAAYCTLLTLQDGGLDE